MIRIMTGSSKPYSELQRLKLWRRLVKVPICHSSMSGSADQGITGAAAPKAYLREVSEYKFNEIMNSASSSVCTQ